MMTSDARDAGELAIRELESFMGGRELRELRAKSYARRDREGRAFRPSAAMFLL